MLSQKGYEVDVAGTLEEALKHASQFAYKIILADPEMPEEDSYAGIKKVKKLQSKAKMIVISVFSPQEMQSQISDTEIFSFIEKPFKADQILSIIKNAVKANDSDSCGEKKYIDINKKIQKEV